MSSATDRAHSDSGTPAVQGPGAPRCAGQGLIPLTTRPPTGSSTLGSKITRVAVVTNGCKLGRQQLGRRVMVWVGAVSRRDQHVGVDDQQRNLAGGVSRGRSPQRGSRPGES